MASRKGIYIYGYYVVLINTRSIPFYTCTLNSKKLKGRTESYFILFLKLNDHQTRWCFNFGIRRIHSNDGKFELN